VQDKSSYSYSGKTITFNQPIPQGVEVRMIVFHNLNLNAPGPGTIIDTSFGDMEMYRNIKIISGHTIGTGENRFTAGPVEIKDGETVEIQGDSTWIIF